MFTRVTILYLFQKYLFLKDYNTTFLSPFFHKTNSNVTSKSLTDIFLNSPSLLNNKSYEFCIHMYLTFP